MQHLYIMRHASFDPVGGFEPGERITAQVNEAGLEQIARMASEVKSTSQGPYAVLTSAENIAYSTAEHLAELLGVQPTSHPELCADAPWGTNQRQDAGLIHGVVSSHEDNDAVVVVTHCYFTRQYVAHALNALLGAKITPKTPRYGNGWHLNLTNGNYELVPQKPQPSVGVNHAWR